MKKQIKQLIGWLPLVILVGATTAFDAEHITKAPDFFLPTWIPYREQVEAVAGTANFIYDLSQFSKTHAADTEWINKLFKTLMHHTTQAIFANEPMDKVQTETTEILKNELNTHQKQVSEYIFIRTLLTLKGEIAKSFPAFKHNLLPIIDETLQQTINQTNPYGDAIARVRTDNTMSSEEQQWRTQRLARIVPAQQQLIDNSVTSENALNIAIAMSGGGYRAMTLTSGYLKGLQEIGILDSSLYVSGLSGSTWFIAPWISQQFTLEEMQQHLEESINTNHFNILGLTKFSAADIEKLFLSIIWPKTIFQEPLGSVDFFGVILAKSLFYRSQNPYTHHLSRQFQTISDGRYPFPLYVAISMHKKQHSTTSYNYHWYEFNPLEVSNLDLGYTIPIWSAGRTFQQGISTNFAPEQSLGYLMGIWGSAYTVNTKDINQQFSFSYENMTNNKDKAFLYFKIKLLELLERLFNTKRLSPAQLSNPWLGMPTNPEDRWIAEKELLTLVDGGLSFNLAAAPYFHKNRNLDLVIICDSSANVSEVSKQKVPAELQKLFDYLKQFGLQYHRTPEPTIELYKTVDQNGPAIVYLNFKKDEVLLRHLIEQKDPLASMIVNNKLLDFDTNLAYTNTFNFNYTAENFAQLSKLGEVIIRAKKSAFLSILKELYLEKQQKSNSPIPE